MKKRPLEGYKMLDLSRYLPGPYSTMILADLGMEVLKVEDPVRKDPARLSGPKYKKESAYFLGVNRNKKSLAVNLRTNEGKEILGKLASTYDIVLENFRPGLLDRLGVGYSALRRINPRIKVNFDTNGFLTEKSLQRVLSFATSITFDLKAYHDEVFASITGAMAEPVLRNAEIIAKKAKDKLWEFRILIIPAINENEVRPLCEFIAAIDRSLPVCFLCFRPNFVLERHAGATGELMRKCVDIAADCGLQNAHWSGLTGLPGRKRETSRDMLTAYESEEAALAASYALAAGCETHPRNCGSCPRNQKCTLKRYRPRIVS